MGTIRKHWKKGLLMEWILLAVAGMLYFGSVKEGYHVDELYSYGLANSEYLPFLHFGEHDYNVKEWMLEYGPGESLVDLARNLYQDYRILKDASFHIKSTEIYQNYLRAQANSADTRTTTWVSGQVYRDYLTVSKSNRFNAASVYYNQRGDVHPPLYYLLLHTVCSVFWGHFSKWFGLAVNLVLQVITLLVFYRMIRNNLGGEDVALAATAVFAFSSGFMSTAMLLRMYALMTLWVVSFCAVHLKIHAEGFSLGKQNRRLLFWVTLLGFLSHYYFVLYAIFTAFGMAAWMLWHRKVRELVRYVLTLAGSAVVGLCVWPFAIRHVFGVYRGQEALQIITGGDFSGYRFQRILQEIFREMLGGRKWLLWLAAIAGLCLVIDRLRSPAGGKKLPVGKILLTILPITAYALVVAQIVPFFTDRYVMCTYPFLALIMTEAVWILGRTVQKVAGEKRQWVSAAVLWLGSLLLFFFGGCLTNTPGYLAPGGQETVKLPPQTACVYVLPDGDWNESATDTSILAQCSQIAVTYQSNLPGVYESYDGQAEYVFVAVQRGLEVETVLGEVREGLGIQTWTELSRREGNAIQVLYGK